jgi:dissimilatory sulfite reductase (desulfoviridin) alpha/beta subunit
VICAFCHTDSVAWLGPRLSAHQTECANCGRTNCEVHEATDDTEADGFTTVHPPQTQTANPEE